MKTPEKKKNIRPKSLMFFFLWIKMIRNREKNSRNKKAVFDNLWIKQASAMMPDAKAKKAASAGYLLIVGRKTVWVQIFITTKKKVTIWIPDHK